MAEPKLLDQYRERLRVKHYSLRTEDAYLHWARRFIYFHGKRHPREMGGPKVEAFLSHLATGERVASSTQNQALAALLFLYRDVLQKELPWFEGLVRAKRPARVPVVLTEGEVRALLGQLDGTRWLATSLLYATGMRLLEGLRLRVKDVDFERREITVRDGKGVRTGGREIVRAGGRESEEPVWTSPTRSSMSGSYRWSCRGGYTTLRPATPARRSLGSYRRCGAPQ